MRRFSAATRRLAQLTAWTLVLMTAGVVASSADEPGAPAVASEGVIVLLKDQIPVSAPSTAAEASRAKSIAADQTGVVAKARRLGGRGIRQFNSVNAMAMTISSDGVAALKGDSAVAAVVPDLMVKLGSPSANVSSSAPNGARSTGTPLANACSSSVSLEPEALQTMHVAYADHRTAADSYVDGSGVKVAYMAEGIDINNPDFLRNGKSVFVDYRDFTGTGPTAPGDPSSTYSEAFGDASAIAAQGNQVYDVENFVNPAHRSEEPCRIRIRGVAPGVDLVGLKTAVGDTAPTSVLIQAVDWAVNVDHVDVLNESIGSNPYVDQQNDPLSLANAAATAAGVTVVVSSGDGGIGNTIGSPSSATDVIAVGASTTYRTYAQITEATNLPGVTGWGDDNISGLSSSGFAQNGRMLDVVAPGDTGWAVCTPDPSLYPGCSTPNGRPTPIQEFGGTSQSAPFTAGVAALVVAAYEKAHPGAGRPSPKLVKQLITSTAQDLGHPANLQGSGEVDALAAVRAAMAVPTEKTSGQGGGATRPANALLVSPSQLDLAGAAGSTVHGDVTVTNLSSTARTITAGARTLMPSKLLASGSLAFDTATLPKFIFAYGDQRAYESIPLTVPAGQDRLSVSYAYDGGKTRIQAALISPSGTLESFSSTQGPSNFGYVETRAPAAGTWTLYVFSILPLSTTVNYQATTERFQPTGSVWPATIRLRPGQSARVHFTTRLDRNPGDTADSMVLGAAGQKSVSVPVSLRSVAEVRTSGTTFTGSASGGDGRGGVAAVEKSYYLDVKPRARYLTATVKFAGYDVSPYNFEGYLVAPDGETMAAHSNVDALDNDIYFDQLSLSTIKPVAGRWKLVLTVDNPVLGTTVNAPFTVHVSEQPNVSATTSGLPQSPRVVLRAGVENTVSVRITNQGPATQTYFADARLNTSHWQPLASQLRGDDLSAVSLNDPNFYAPYLVPDDSDGVIFGARAHSAIVVDAQYFLSDPEIAAGPGTTAAAGIFGRHVAAGYWLAKAQLLGPFSSAAPAETARYFAYAHTADFDPSITSSTGDYWMTAFTSPTSAGKTAAGPTGAANARSGSAAPAERTQSAEPNIADGPVRLLSGQSATISITITPTAAQRGKVTSGQIFIDSLDTYWDTANQVIALPYSYTTR